MTLPTFLVRYIAPMFSAVVLLSVIRFVDTNFLPPVTVFDVQTIRVDSDAVYLSGRLYKPEYRASCKLHTVVAVVNHTDYAVIYPEGDHLLATRPPGWSTFNDLRIPGKKIRDVTLTSRHSCYGAFAWDHSTTLVILKLEQSL